jgi:3-methyladenine DNA glycosylase AlkD
MNAANKHIVSRLKELADPETATQSMRFFKTGKGEYGEGDQFIGIRVPVIRKCVKDFADTSIEDNLELLTSPIHEARLLALLLLVAKYKKTESDGGRREIYKSYLRNTQYINNWDLVDVTAEHIIGAYLFERSRKPLYKLVKSKSLWERRISVLATFYFIRRRDFSDTLNIAELLRDDKEDLIHKAVGWMLREVGKRDHAAEREFLEKHCKAMPRTMLRYAIEKFPEEERLAFLHGKI